MRQVAVYPRVSTGMQASEGTSLEGQLELCYKKARSLNISKEEIREYIESGFTGEDIDRPALNALMQDVKDKKIGKLIVTHPDRLTRDLTDKLIICRELEKNDVELIFVDTEYLTTPEGQLFFNMMSSIAQYELQLIKKNSKGKNQGGGERRKDNANEGSAIWIQPSWWRTNYKPRRSKVCSSDISMVCT
ncbi:recombinase family protein [Paenibacillus amylolyticus]|nr:recombinase family protein [Paenibacillus amylolyticus]